jgi:hypothetical protein
MCILAHTHISIICIVFAVFEAITLLINMIWENFQNNMMIGEWSISAQIQFYTRPSARVPALDFPTVRAISTALHA